MKITQSKMCIKTSASFAWLSCVLTFCVCQTVWAQTTKPQTTKPQYEQFVKQPLAVPQGVAWRKRTVPSAIRRILPSGAKLIKYGIADIGAQGAMRWVLAWTDGTTNKDGETETHVSIFSQQKTEFTKIGEHNVGFPSKKIIRLYWLKPKMADTPVVHFGSTFGYDDLISFPNGWKGNMIAQNFSSSHFYPHDYYFELPRIDENGVLCVAQFHDFQDGEKIFTDQAILHWDGAGWK